jgi:hypothetical protein
MQKIVSFSLVLLLATSCQNQERERQLQQKEAALNQREQELVLRENTLTLREQSLAKATQVLDSARTQQPTDSVQAGMLGTWAARMDCTETSCPGSAIGDSKNEQWEISYEQNAVLVKATFNDKVQRVYSGAFNGSTLELTAQHLTNETLPDATITVRLQLMNNRRLEGVREIDRPGNCRIVYALQLTKDAAVPAP